MKEIILASGEKCLIDNEDYEWLSLFHWYKVKTTNTFYARATVAFKTKKQMHRLICEKYFNLNKYQLIDHKDKNGLNNQKNNFRISNKSQNALNSNKNKSLRNKSKFKGVTYVKRSHKWGAQIMNNYKANWLGCFNTEEEAAKAYDKEARLIYGEFAQLNFPN